MEEENFLREEYVLDQNGSYFIIKSSVENGIDEAFNRGHIGYVNGSFYIASIKDIGTVKIHKNVQDPQVYRVVYGSRLADEFEDKITTTIQKITDKKRARRFL